MKPTDFTLVLTADQVASRTNPDGVPAALQALASLRTLLPWERTAGDEIQALFLSAADVIEAVGILTRLGGWRIGLGCGPVEAPLPNSTRAARGAAYLAARDALTAARREPTSLALRRRTAVGGDDYSHDHAAERAETALWLWRGLLARRSQEGWELMDLLDTGLSRADAARRLGVSPSAVSQRLAVAGRQEGLRGAHLCVSLLEALASEGA